MTDPTPHPSEPTPAPSTDAPSPPLVSNTDTGTTDQRSILRRVFGIGLWGALKLTAVCILVGFFVMAANFDPRAPDANIPAAVAAIFRQTMAAAGWALRNFWQPALAGATIVLPIWIIWRLISLPFRK